MNRLIKDSQRRLNDQLQQGAKFEGQLPERNTELSNLMRNSEELQRQRALQHSTLNELRMHAADLRAQPAQVKQGRDRGASQARAQAMELSKKEAECKESQELIKGLEAREKTLSAKVSELKRQLSLAS
ncbi:hypothetical protein HPB51_007477 [Rhipicephalus microplus]|uniref:Uncharacterized protein n=1 Tax=Rhipicephalus microplus TaxID=6941 RepID=A0A9J6ENA7_RHIMP|nr:hypothetical protein HPB51_007477 [Rhipicephalus microplus]